MRLLFLCFLTTIFNVGKAQVLPSTYPSCYFEFKQTDSIPYKPLYSDWLVRDSLMQNYGEGNRHMEALAVESYLLWQEKNSFLARQIYNNGQWNIQLLNGKNFELKIPKYSDVADYAFEYYYKDLNLIIFREQWSEGNAYLIVNRNSGEAIRTIGPPIFSPDGNFFLAINDDIEAGYSPNGIQLYKIEGNKITLLLEYIMDLAPSRANWVSDSTFQLEVYSVNWEKNVSREYLHYLVSIRESKP